MNNIFILDGKTDEILGHINKKYVIHNEHEKDLPSHKDYFRFTVLADNKHTEHLTKRNGLIVPGEDGELLEFRIFESIKYRNNEGLFIEVHALATYLDLKTQKIFDPHKSNPETAQQHAKIALQGTEWQLGEVDFKGIRTLTFDNPFNSYDYILRIAREFELEPRFYIKTDGNKITGRYVDLVERIGEFRGRTIEFGRDLQRIERKEDTSNIVTALWVYGPEREDGTRLKVFVEDNEARERWGRKGKHIVDYYEPETENQDITEERLETLGNMELRKRINAVVTYEAEILDLENVPGLENKKIRFGDTIRIKDVYFNPPLYLEARIFNVKRDVFNKAKKTAQLGDYVEYTEEEVKALFRQMQAEIRRRLERLVLVSIISSAGNVFKNGIGSTELTAKTFLSGNEVDEDGTKYEYRWHKFDKNGGYVQGFYEEGKSITINASTIDEKATFRVEIILDDEVLTVQEITLTNVFDGEQGPPGPNVVDENTQFGDGYDPTEIEIGGRNYISQSNLIYNRYINHNDGNELTATGHTATGFIEVVPNTDYTFSTAMSNFVNPRVVFYDENQTYIYGIVEISSSIRFLTFTTPSNAKYVRVSAGGGLDRADTFQLEKGNKATDWTPAPEDVQEQIDEAKQEAEEAKQEAQNAMISADGKNAVFRQSNTPPTADRKIGDLWFKTDEGNKMFVWTGSWTETKLDYQALSVNKLSAISADLGNMTAGHIEGVTMNLAGGKFVVDEYGNVTFKGHLDGASGSFSGDITGSFIYGGHITLSDLDPLNEGYSSQLSPNRFQISYSDERGIVSGTIFTKGAISYDYLQTDGDKHFTFHMDDAHFTGSVLIKRSGGSLKLQSVSDSNATHLEYLGFDGNRMGFIGYGSTDNDDLYIRNENGDTIRLESDILRMSAPLARIGGTSANTTSSLSRIEFYNQGFNTRMGRIGYLGSSDTILGIQNNVGNEVRIYGNMTASGSKSAVVETESYGTRKLYAVEAPDVRFVSYSEHVLEEGEHWIDIEPMFLETINENDYFVVPHVQNASDVIILERRNGKFRVWVYGHTAEVVFEINGKRKGYEGVYMEKAESVGDIIDE